MLLDVVHLYQAFVGDLPETYSQFKFELARYFPLVYDTKYLFHVSQASKLKIFNF